MDSISSLCLVSVVLLFLTVPRVCLQFVIVVFPDHTYLLFLLCSIMLQASAIEINMNLQNNFIQMANQVGWNWK